MDVEQILTEHIQNEYMIDKPGMTLASDTMLIDRGIIDSLGIFLLVDFIQNRFGITVNPDEIVIENFETINAIKTLVEKKL